MTVPLMPQTVWLSFSLNNTLYEDLPLDKLKGKIQNVCNTVNSVSLIKIM